MKKLLLVFALIFIVSCEKDPIIDIVSVVEVPESLEISNISGLKLENTIVSSEVRMNVKLPNNGTYRVKIRDIGNKLVSQEEIKADQGDNILSVYTTNLDKSSYTIELINDNNKVLGRAVFVNQ